jgi:hypothetical protein
MDQSILTAINNADYLLQSLIKLKSDQADFVTAELIGLSKMTVTQIIILKAPSYREGLDVGIDSMDFVPDEHKKLIE